MVRTALFNWAFARHNDATFVFRIEDTDSARDSEDSYNQLLDSLKWLGLTWDEGPEVGGQYGPYRQSERMDIYRDVVEKLLNANFAYRCYCSVEELEEQRENQKKAGTTPGYSGRCRDLTEDQRQGFEAEDRKPAIRFRMPGTDFTWDDLVRGELTFAKEHVPDFVIVRATGEPLYTLVNPVDDALMHITHVLRGEDLLSSTPRQIAMHNALAEIGVGSGRLPYFGHLPYVMGEGNRKLSKRDPESALLMYREEGYLPEGLLNYLALLGWSMGDDQEFFSIQEMAERFDIKRVSGNPARFDLKKCTSINGDWIRSLNPEDLSKRLIPFLVKENILPEVPNQAQRDMVRSATPLVQSRMETLRQGAAMLGFLFFQDNEEVEVTEATRPFEIEASERSQINEEAKSILAIALGALTNLDEWNHVAIEACLRAELLEKHGLKPKNAFGPVRLATAGRRVSPPLFESLELLGKSRSLYRIESALHI
jgi:glutamyl-tRNA synthetase